MHAFQVLAITLASASMALADCCAPRCNGLNWSADCRDTKCDDGTESTPYCGVGPCNVFGCNCDGGCRKAASAMASADGSDYTPSSAEDLAEGDAHDFGTVDKDGSGNVTMDEFIQHVGGGVDSDKFAAWFDEHDKDGNGVLTPDEVRN